MRELPIPFQPDMANATVKGRKTETRRTRGLKEINKEPDKWHFAHLSVDHNGILFARFLRASQKAVIRCPYGNIGDVLWVREKFSPPTKGQIPTAYMYAADYPVKPFVKGIWKPSIHMPKAAARIWLQVVDIKVERLQDISEEDAKAEGVEYDGHGGCYVYKSYVSGSLSYNNAKSSFKSLWHSINGFESWFSNPWVWVVKFKVLSTTGRPAHLPVLSA